MARSTRTVTDIALAGITPAFTAADNANGEQIPNDGHMFIEVKNTGGGPCTVTLNTNGIKVAGITIPNPTVSVPATTGDKIIGPFDPTVFNQAGGYLNVDYSTGTGVTVQAVHLNT